MAHGDVMKLQLLHPPTPDTRGGLITVNTDGNGQATITFPEPFSIPPDSIVVSPKNQLVSLGVLELTETYVLLWAWDLSAGGWADFRPVNVYWMGLFNP